MKRTLAISLMWASGIAAAQNPAVVQKNVQTAVKATATAQTTTVSVKPSPATVKVAKTNAAKATPAVVSAKPVVAVQAAAAKAIAVPAAKSSVVTAKPVAIQVKPAVGAQATAVKTVSVAAAKPTAVAVKPAAPAVKPAVALAVPVVKSGPRAAPVAVKAGANVKVSKPAVAKADPFKSGKPQLAVATKVDVSKPSSRQDSSDEIKSAEAKSVGQAGRRDPFISPVVNMGAVGSGCSSGKRCLAIDQIALRGVVKSDNGMIAVVVNATDKAYFLRENDPVFNGYVIKITGDSIVFKETVHDKLGKSLTRDITKTISRPVA